LVGKHTEKSDVETNFGRQSAECATLPLYFHSSLFVSILEAYHSKGKAMKWKLVIGLLVHAAITLAEWQENLRNLFFVWACVGHPMWHMKLDMVMKKQVLFRALLLASL